jgi:hypothetical protein
VAAEKKDRATEGNENTGRNYNEAKSENRGGGGQEAAVFCVFFFWKKRGAGGTEAQQRQ